MISGSSAIGSDWFLNGISNLQQQELKTEQQLSSGYKVQDAADSPAQTPELVHLGSSLATLQAWQTNLSRVQVEANTADTALGSAITLLTQARSLAASGAGSLSDTNQRNNLASQVQSIQAQVVALANTTVEGRYIFGGGADQSAPYTIDALSATGVDALTNPGGGRVITNPSGQTIFEAGTAATIFDPHNAGGAPSAANTFAALQSLVTALQTNNQSGISTALTSVENASDWVNQQQAGYGVAEARITNEQNNSSDQITSLQSQISGIRDTDVAAAASDLTRETTAQTAAFSAQSEIPRKSLFDYLA